MVQALASSAAKARQGEVASTHELSAIDEEACETIMSNMEVVTVRDVQHHLKRVLAYVASGQHVEVTRRGKIVAVINPPPAVTPARWPDFMKRLKKNFPHGAKGKPVSRIVIEQREERV